MPCPPASPRRPAATPARAAAAILLGLAGLAGCSGGLEVPTCPGDPVGLFALVATRTAAACQGDTAPADGTAACAALVPPVSVDCQAGAPVPACCFDRLFPPAREVQVAIAYGAQGDTASLCPQRAGALAYLGSRTAVAGGEALDVSLDTFGAVLSSCATTCAVTVRHRITGLVARDPVSGAATGFTGESVEEASATASAVCGACVTPCAATWSLAPAP